MDRPITGGKWDVVHDFNVESDRRGIANTGGYSTNADGGAHVIENMENARLIALAGTVANQLFDAGLDGIEAVKALPELVQLAVARVERGHSSFCSPFLNPDTDAECDCGFDVAQALLDRLKGDAK